MKKYKLEIIVFITGAAVMILELVGSRILAPYVGNSIYTWSALMGVVLGALALGYFFGGRLADKKPNFKILAKIILVASINIMLVAFFKDGVAKASVFSGIKIGSIIACLFLFALPSFLLGMVSPYAIKLKLKEIEKIGNVAGNLYALSTAGSIAGTFLAGFILIPNFKITNILFSLSFVLFLLFLLLLDFKINKKSFLFILFFLLWSATLFLENNNQYLLNKNTAYASIKVYDTLNQDEQKIRELSLNNEKSSAIFLDIDKNELVHKYMKYYRLDDFFNKNIKNSLLLGGGGYVVAQDFLNRNEQGEIDVVEIDPEVTEAAYKYFNLENNDRLNIYHQDGRVFMNNNQKKYSAVYMNVFKSLYYIPWHLTTKEFFNNIYNFLEKDGVLIVNINASLKENKNNFLWAEYKTLENVFDQVFLIPLKPEDSNSVQNVMLIALKNKDFDLDNNLNNLKNKELKSYLDKIYKVKQKTIDNAIVLTDDFAPVESYVISEY